jgi:hypothetical protein
MHLECNVENFIKKEHLEEEIDTLMKRFSHIDRYEHLVNFKKVADNFEEQFNHFDAEINLLKHKIIRAIENNLIYKFSKLKRKVKE